MRTEFWLASGHSPILTQLPSQANEVTPRKMHLRQSPTRVKKPPKKDKSSPSLRNSFYPNSTPNHLIDEKKNRQTLSEAVMAKRR
jgi:hypothetical protein